MKSEKRNTNTIQYHLHVESKIWHKWTYLWNRLTENRLVVAKVGVGWVIEWKVRVSRCKLLRIGWINNKILLYSAENYIQYPMINHNGKEYEKVYIYIKYIYMKSIYIYMKSIYIYWIYILYIKVYVYLNHFTVLQKLIQHHKSTILWF